MPRSRTLAVSQTMLARFDALDNDTALIARDGAPAVIVNEG
jgi:hypothetical protein